MKFLSAPWRWNFISKIGGARSCIFCQAAKQSAEETLICFRGKQFFIILNKYPYATAHLMIVPFKHLATPDLLSSAEVVEMWDLMNRSIDIIQKKFHPDGFNIGINLGKSAGAGVTGHFHLHVVPRWQGDANFMVTIGKTKVMSYNIKEIHKILQGEYNR